MDGHEGIAPSTPVWKTGVCLSTPMPEDRQTAVLLRRRMPDVFEHGSIRNWSARQDLHLDPSVPGRVRWLLRYALMSLTSVSSGQEKRRTPTLARSCGKLVEKIGGPEGGCTLNRPADN